jgi:hypothetical protein
MFRLKIPALTDSSNRPQVVAIVVTGLFSYLQRRKTTLIMQKFENLIPQSATCIRNGEKVQFKNFLTVQLREKMNFASRGTLRRCTKGAKFDPQGKS